MKLYPTILSKYKIKKHRNLFEGNKRDPFFHKKEKALKKQDTTSTQTFRKKDYYQTTFWRAL